MQPDYKMLSDKVDKHDKTLYGEDGELGIAQMVKVVWKSYIWVAMLFCTIFGYCGKWVIDHIGTK